MPWTPHFEKRSPDKTKSSNLVVNADAFMYYNIHAHHSSELPGVLCIENIYQNFKREIAGENVSMGLHPWYLDEAKLANQLEELAGNSAKLEVLAIGECGLDKLCTTDWALQLDAFQRQIELAAELNKPLIIHCVKAFTETLTQLDNTNVPVIFHGVNNKLSVLKPVIDAGHFLSFGKSLLSHNESILNTFRATPMQQVFLETDDSEIDIREVYKAAALIKNIPEKEIVLQLEKNFSNVFVK